MTERFFRTSCPFVNMMARAAFKASARLIRDFGEIENLKVSRKGAADFVSSADRQAESTLYSILKDAYPSYGFLMEESGYEKGEEDKTFVIDPLDGTTNFLHGLPHFAISIALCRGSKPVAALIFDPLRDEIFWASEGKGAFIDQRKMRLKSSGSLPASGLLGINNWHMTSLLKEQENLRLRLSGSAALDLAYVAAGRLDGFIGSKLCRWDYAAASLLITEARGLVSVKSFADKKANVWATSPTFQPLINSLSKEALL